MKSYLIVCGGDSGWSFGEFEFLVWLGELRGSDNRIAPTSRRQDLNPEGAMHLGISG